MFSRKGLSRTSNGFVWGPVISRTGSSLAFSTYVHTPTYAGLLERNDEYLPGLHEVIVSHENFDQVMALRQTKVGPDQFAKMAVGNSEFFLTGVMRCGVCGGAVVGTAANSKGRHYRYYAALESGELLASDVRGRLESLERQLEAQRRELARLQHEREASLGRRARRVGRGEFRTPRSGDVAGSDGR